MLAPRGLELEIRWAAVKRQGLNPWPHRQLTASCAWFHDW